MDSFIGEIRVFGFTYPPEGWAYCNGQSVAASQYQALYSVIGNLYGGTPRQPTFSLPNLCGRVPMGAGAGPGLTPYDVGNAIGTESVTLSPEQNAPHNHTLNAQNPNNATTMSHIDSVPTATHWLSRVVHTNPAPPPLILKAYAPDSSTVPNMQFAPAAVGPAGGGQAHENRQPSLAMSFCIALSGEYYPTRP